MQVAQWSLNSPAVSPGLLAGDRVGVRPMTGAGWVARNCCCSLHPVGCPGRRHRCCCQHCPAHRDRTPCPPHPPLQARGRSQATESGTAQRSWSYSPFPGACPRGILKGLGGVPEGGSGVRRHIHHKNISPEMHFALPGDLHPTQRPHSCLKPSHHPSRTPVPTRNPQCETSGFRVPPFGDPPHPLKACPDLSSRPQAIRLRTQSSHWSHEPPLNDSSTQTLPTLLRVGGQGRAGAISAHALQAAQRQLLQASLQETMLSPKLFFHAQRPTVLLLQFLGAQRSVQRAQGWGWAAPPFPGSVAPLLGRVLGLRQQAPYRSLRPRPPPLPGFHRRQYLLALLVPSFGHCPLQPGPE